MERKKEKNKKILPKIEIFFKKLISKIPCAKVYY